MRFGAWFLQVKGGLTACCNRAVVLSFRFFYFSVVVSFVVCGLLPLKTGRFRIGFVDVMLLYIYTLMMV
jgi:hypothetical protein